MKLECRRLYFIHRYGFMEGNPTSQRIIRDWLILNFKTTLMYNIHVYSEGAIKLFEYNSDVIPVKDDVYAATDESKKHYTVTKRLLHTSPNMPNVISLWVRETRTNT